MKQVYMLLTLIVLTLTACNAASTPTGQAVTAQEATVVADIVSSTQTALAPTAIVVSPSTSSPELTTNYENATPVSMQLLVGVLQLDGTDQAITSSQAESLITVLNFLKDLSTNTSATQEQFESIMEQAESILTDEQVAAIANMKITPEAAMSLMQEQGLTMGNPEQRNSNPPPQSDMPQGTPPAGGPGGPPASADPMGTPSGDGTQPPMGFVPPQLIDALIQYMESKSASS